MYPDNAEQCFMVKLLIDFVNLLIILGSRRSHLRLTYRQDCIEHGKNDTVGHVTMLGAIFRRAVLILSNLI